MNMVKEGIQTRRRKQKSSANNSIVKTKHPKTSMKTSTSSESNPHHSMLTKPEDYLPRQSIPSYGEIYPSHLHVVHHPFETTQHFPSHQQMDVSTNPNTFHPRDLFTSSLTKSDEEHLNLIKTIHSN